LCCDRRASGGFRKWSSAIHNRGSPAHGFPGSINIAFVHATTFLGLYRNDPRGLSFRLPESAADGWTTGYAPAERPAPRRRDQVSGLGRGLVDHQESLIFCQYGSALSGDAEPLYNHNLQRAKWHDTMMRMPAYKVWAWFVTAILAGPGHVCVLCAIGSGNSPLDGPQPPCRHQLFVAASIINQWVRYDIRSSATFGQHLFGSSGIRKFTYEILPRHGNVRSETTVCPCCFSRQNRYLVQGRDGLRLILAIGCLWASMVWCHHRFMRGTAPTITAFLSLTFHDYGPRAVPLAHEDILNWLGHALHAGGSGSLPPGGGRCCLRGFVSLFPTEGSAAVPSADGARHAPLALTTTSAGSLSPHHVAVGVDIQESLRRPPSFPIYGSKMFGRYMHLQRIASARWPLLVQFNRHVSVDSLLCRMHYIGMAPWEAAAVLQMTERKQLSARSDPFPPHQKSPLQLRRAVITHRGDSKVLVNRFLAAPHVQGEEARDHPWEHPNVIRRYGYSGHRPTDDHFGGKTPVVATVIMKH